MIKILIGALLTLATANAVADNVFIYEDKGHQVSNEKAVVGNIYINKARDGQALLNHVSPSGNSIKKVKVTYHKNSKGSKVSKMQNVSYGSSSNSDSASYADSAYIALR